LDRLSTLISGIKDQTCFVLQLLRNLLFSGIKDP